MVKYRRYVRRITPKLYKELKLKLHYPEDDDAVRKEYKLGKTTVRAIRNSDDWFDYRRRTGHRLENETNESLPDYSYEDSEPADVQKQYKPEHKPSAKTYSQTAQNAEQNALARVIGLFIIFCFCLIIGGITISVLRWALGV